MEKDKNKYVWANCVNLSGLVARGPLKCYWYPDIREYYDSSLNFSVKREGQEICDTGGCITFASKSKQRVLDWTKGAQNVMKLLRVWSE